MGKNEVLRLEHFISLAKEGHHIAASVELKKQIVIKEIQEDDSGAAKDTVKMYLLLAEYSFTVEAKIKKVPKIYSFGTSEESIMTTHQNILFANERLKMDYARMKSAHIAFEEKYFE